MNTGNNVRQLPPLPTLPPAEVEEWSESGITFKGEGWKKETVEKYATDYAIAAIEAQVKPQRLSDEQITAGARALCKRSSAICGVNADDNWNLESEYFKDDARCVLEAAHGIFAEPAQVIKE